MSDDTRSVVGAIGGCAIAGLALLAFVALVALSVRLFIWIV